MSQKGNPTTTGAIQQDDNYAELMSWITNGGLRYAGAKYNNNDNPGAVYQKMVPSEHIRHVIVVGAGMAGLAAAYELAQVGHKVTILETQGRVGGRVKTIREGFCKGLYAEAGAMRIPPNHYLTHHYLDLFGVKMKPFSNSNPRAYIKVDDKPPVRLEDFERENQKYTDEWFPGWDTNLSPALKKDLNITGILSLFQRTIEPVKTDLGKNPTNEDWKRWIQKWSTLSLLEYLRCDDHQSENQPKLRPWTEEAVTALMISVGLPKNAPLTWVIRKELGGYWKDPLTTPVDGMDSLPKAFMMKNINGWNKNVKLLRNTFHGITVRRVEEIYGMYRGVRVFGTNNTTGKQMIFDGDAVILTVPLTILRNLEVPLSDEKQKALANIGSLSATRILLQCKTRFWQNDVGQGGFSWTNQPIGQLQYPDYNGSGIPNDERGILLMYIWDEYAIMFGTKDEASAVDSSVHQVSKLHPEVHDQFEVGRVHAWHTDPTSNGAVITLNQYEYLESFHTLVAPTETIYLASDTLSWSNGWIQGAIFSGLVQAFCFQQFVEHGRVVDPLHLDI